MKIVKICLPYYSEQSIEKGCLEFCETLSNTKHKDYEFLFSKKQHSYLPHLRNYLITKSQVKFQKHFIDYFLFIDSDIIPKIDDIFKLLDSNKEIIGGVYNKRNSKNYSTGYFYEGSNGFIIKDLNDSDLKEEIMKVDYVGAGFLLIKKSALEKMEYPYFREYMTQHPFLENVQDTTSECVGFCVHAKKFNIPIFINTLVKLQHIGT